MGKWNAMHRSGGGQQQPPQDPISSVSIEMTDGFRAVGIVPTMTQAELPGCPVTVWESPDNIQPYYVVQGPTPTLLENGSLRDLAYEGVVGSWYKVSAQWPGWPDHISDALQATAP